MFTTFDQIEDYIRSSGIRRTIALAGAHDEYSLDALVEAKRKGLVAAILIGKEQEIRQVLAKLGENAADYEIIDCPEESKTGELAVQLVREGKADMPMKGMIQTSDYLRPILRKENCFIEPGALLSQATVIELREEGRLLLIGDCAVNIEPSLEQKKKIIQNTQILMDKLGISPAKVAVLSTIEKVNPKIISTVHAQELKQACAQGEFGDTIVSGPFAFDNAVSKQAAEHKGINDPVAGNADFILVPEICVGNSLVKAVTYFTDLRSGALFLGTRIPVAAASRTDTPENKFRSILLSLLLSY